MSTKDPMQQHMPTDSSPAVELVGPWLKNNGDGLNLWSVVGWARGSRGGGREGGAVRLGVSSMLGCEALPEEADLSWVQWPAGLGDLASSAKRGEAKALVRQLGQTAALTLLPPAKLTQRRWIDGRRLAGLLDCSGFAYGDVWSLPRVERRIQHYGRVKHHGGKLILLPQAFGPFTRPDVRDRVGTLLRMCDLIFARDRISLEHLQTLPGLEDKLAVAPDITHLLEGQAPRDADLPSMNPGSESRGKGGRVEGWSQTVLIVPNARMLDRTEAEVAEGYEALVGAAVAATRDAGLVPRLMVHEANDRPLAERLARRYLADAQVEDVIIQEDARRSKGIIAASFAVIGSRYHALISALSSGVPALGTSWHHKYEELFDDYGRDGFLLSPADPPEKQQGVFAELLDRDGRAAAAASVAERAAQQKAQVAAAWARVESCLGLASPGDAAAEAAR